MPFYEKKNSNAKSADKSKIQEKAFVALCFLSELSQSRMFSFKIPKTRHFGLHVVLRHDFSTHVQPPGHIAQNQH